MPHDEQSPLSWPRTPVLTVVGAMAAAMVAYLLMPPLSIATMAFAAAGAAAFGAVLGYAAGKSLNAGSHAVSPSPQPAPGIGIDALSREVLTPAALEHYTDTAIARANRYIADNLPASGEAGGRLAGRNEQETAHLRAYLASSPYDKAEVRQLTRQIIIDTIANAEPATGERSVTYLAGPLGSKGMLLAAASDNRIDTPEITLLRKNLKRSVISDFQAYKDRVASYTGQDIEPYARWRGLLSGIDQTVAEIARKQALNVVLDNTLAVGAGEYMSSVIRSIREERQSGQVSMTAVALTPAQARQEAGRQGLSTTEAEKTVRDFQHSFPALCENIPDVTLLDKDLQVLYKQVNFQLEACDTQRLEAWITSAAGSSPDPAPAGHQARLAMQRLKNNGPCLS